MFDEPVFQSIDASLITPVAMDSIECSAPLAHQFVPVVPGAAIAYTQDKPLVFPVSLKDIAAKLGISYATLRNKWISKIEEIYEGLDCALLRDKSKQVTAFGYRAIQNFVDEVVRGGIDYETHKAEMRSLFVRKTEALPPTAPQLEPMTVSSRSITVQPLMDFDVSSLNVEMPEADTSAIDSNTADLQRQTIQAVGVLAQFVAKDLQAKLQTILSQNTNFAQAMQSVAVQQAAQSLDVGKPQSAPSPGL
jgi:hypothetical protein